MAELSVFKLNDDDVVALRMRGLLPDHWTGPAPWPEAGLADTGVLRSRFRGCLVGGAIGDALGRRGEGRRPETIAERYGKLRDFHPWRGWQSGPRGTITDDTQLSIEVAQTYIECGCIDPSLLAQRIARWLSFGRGKGGTCTMAAQRIRSGAAWTESGIPAAGNGAAMRAAPVGLARAGDIEALRLDAALSALPTHADGMAIASAASMAFAVAYLLRTPSGKLDPGDFVHSIVRCLDGIPDAGHRERRDGAGDRRVRLAERIAELPALLDLSWQEAMQRTWNGAFVLESLPAAFWFFLAYGDDPEEAIVRAASAGFDADTVAAMTGNLVGAFHGLEALPERWRNDLEYHDELIGLADGLFELGATGLVAEPRPELASPVDQRAVAETDTSSAEERFVAPSAEDMAWITETHQALLGRTDFEPCCNLSIFSTEEVEWLERRGHWLTALAEGVIRPFTEAQAHFVDVANNRAEPSTRREEIWWRYRERRRLEAVNDELVRHDREYEHYDPGEDWFRREDQGKMSPYYKG